MATVHALSIQLLAQKHRQSSVSCTSEELTWHPNDDDGLTVNFPSRSIFSNKKKKRRLNFVISEKRRFSCIIIYQTNGLQIICRADKTFSYYNECRNFYFSVGLSALFLILYRISSFRKNAASLLKIKFNCL